MPELQEIVLNTSPVIFHEYDMSHIVIRCKIRWQERVK